MQTLSRMLLSHCSHRTSLTMNRPELNHHLLIEFLRAFGIAREHFKFDYRWRCSTVLKLERRNRRDFRNVSGWNLDIATEVEDIIKFTSDTKMEIDWMSKMNFLLAGRCPRGTSNIVELLMKRPLDSPNLERANTSESIFIISTTVSRGRKFALFRRLARLTLVILTHKRTKREG